MKQSHNVQFAEVMKLTTRSVHSLKPSSSTDTHCVCYHIVIPEHTVS